MPRSAAARAVATMSTGSFVVVAACLATLNLLVVFDGLVVTVALPAMAHALGTDASASSWVITAFAAPLGGTLLLGGRLGDRVGARPCFVGGLVVFALGLLGSGLAGTFPVLLAGRVLQGLGAGLALPNTFALASAVPAPGRRSAVFAASAVAGSSGSAGAAVIGGLLVDGPGLAIGVPGRGAGGTGDGGPVVGSAAPGCPRPAGVAALDVERVVRARGGRRSAGDQRRCMGRARRDGRGVGRVRRHRAPPRGPPDPARGAGAAEPAWRAARHAGPGGRLHRDRLCRPAVPPGRAGPAALAGRAGVRAGRSRRRGREPDGGSLAGPSGVAQRCGGGAARRRGSAAGARPGAGRVVRRDPAGPARPRGGARPGGGPLNVAAGLDSTDGKRGAAYGVFETTTHLSSALAVSAVAVVLGAAATSSDFAPGFLVQAGTAAVCGLALSVRSRQRRF